MPTVAKLARRLDADLWILDTMHQHVPGVIAVYLLEGPDGFGLVDVGPGATLDTVLTAIEQTGHDVGELRHIVLTHVHLDHAGAAGALAGLAPDALVHVHPLGAPHLVDPQRLLASAARIYGAQMPTLWGMMQPVPSERVRVLDDDHEIRVGKWRLRAMHTPGHAVHHIAYYDGIRTALFAGDVAGVALEGVDFVRPPTPPPDLNLEAWSKSLFRLRELTIDQMYLPHFGPVTRVKPHLAELETRLYQWGEIVLSGMRQGKGTDALVADLVQANASDLPETVAGRTNPLAQRYELATNYRMTVQGYERYYRIAHPERLSE